MPRQPSIPGTVPAARMPVTDETLDRFIEISDMAQRHAVGEVQADLLCTALPAVLRELRQHRRLAALPPITPHAVPANVAAAPMRVS